MRLHIAHQVDKAINTAIQQLSDYKVTETLHNPANAICLEVHGIRPGRDSNHKVYMKYLMYS